MRRMAQRVRGGVGDVGNFSSQSEQDYKDNDGDFLQCFSCIRFYGSFFEKTLTLISRGSLLVWSELFQPHMLWLIFALPNQKEIPWMALLDSQRGLDILCPGLSNFLQTQKDSAVR
jgi:hypothetical protein